MKKSDVIQKILGDRYHEPPMHVSGSAFAPTNIALCKYWGKRDQELNLPVTSSLSVSLGEKGAQATLTLCAQQADTIILNNRVIAPDSAFSQRLIQFLDLFRQPNTRFTIDIESNIPIAAGLASSAAGFASMIKALNKVMGWELADEQLSHLARLGSGSAARSIWQGFVEWHAGDRADGFDSVGEVLPSTWNELCIGLLIFDATEKPLSSREAMQRTVMTSPLFPAWPNKVAEDLEKIKVAIQGQQFTLLGATAESNALAMHATMHAAQPAIQYSLPATVQAMEKIWNLRRAGLDLYFTQDAGPNLKLLFLKSDLSHIQHHFPIATVIQPFMSIAPF